MPSNKKLLQAAAGNAGESLYVEDVFSNYLWAGNSTAGRVIVNDIDVSGEGGLVWIKDRTGINGNGDSHSLFTTTQGANKTLLTNTTGAEDTVGTDVFQAFNSNGFTVGSHGRTNENNRDYVSWTFRKAEKFFDVVTYTGTGDSAPGQTVAHNLGSTPGFMIIKRTDLTSDWSCYHSGLTSNEYFLRLNRDNATLEDGTVFPSAPTDSNFYVRADRTNINGGTFVAYLFASDAGGFGDDGSESIIKCGSYTGNGNSNGPEVNLGFEPQFLMVKNTTGGNWVIADTMRSFGVEDMASLYPNAANAESTIIAGKGITPTATGFKCIDGNATTNQNSASHIYIAIRRPMKTPESGTEVFSPVAYSGNSTAGRSITSGFPLDWVVTKGRNAGIEPISYTRLQGSGRKLLTYSSAAEANSSTNVITSFDQDGMTVGTDTDINNSSYTYIDYFFKRATGFFDVVAYQGSASVYQKPHNLGVVPELMIVKNRTAAETSWSVYTATTGANNRLQLDSTGASSATSDWDNASDEGVAPTATHFNVKAASVIVNSASYSYIAYLFASLDGVSKVGSYTGTGSNVNVDCGFSAGARFILIKRTNSTGDWYVWDTARGIIAGNDPYLLLNSAAAEVTNTDYIDPLSSGFTVTSSAPAALNASGGTYIFLAIA